VATNPNSTFETSIEKTNLILKEIEKAYGWTKDKRNQSFAALRTVLHLLRDRLPIEESAQFAAQLPLLLRGVYYEGWDPTAVPIKLSREDFLFEVRRGFPYDVEGGTERVVQVVLDALQRHVTEGEWADVKSSMPKTMRRMMP
jgi:uncharacterized protein (DUF2267 family)